MTMSGHGASRTRWGAGVISPGDGNNKQVICDREDNIYVRDVYYNNAGTPTSLVGAIGGSATAVLKAATFGANRVPVGVNATRNVVDYANFTYDGTTLLVQNVTASGAIQAASLAATFAITSGTSITATTYIQAATTIIGGNTYTPATYGAGDVGKFLRVSAASTVAASTYKLPTSVGASGTALRSDGTDYIATVYTLPATAGTANQSLQSNGTNLVLASPLVPPTFLKPYMLLEWGRVSTTVIGNFIAITTTAPDYITLIDSVGTPDTINFRWRVKGYLGAVKVVPHISLLNFTTDATAFCDILLNSPEVITSATFTGTSIVRWGAGGVAIADTFASPPATQQSPVLSTYQFNATMTGNDTITVTFHSNTNVVANGMTLYGIAIIPV